MLGSMLIALLALVDTVAPGPGEACGIVVGHTWAFVSQPPAAWTSACGDRAMAGTALTMWPAEQNSDTAKALIYVTVSDKGGQTLARFASDDLARFKSDAGHPERVIVGTPEILSPSRTLAHIENSRNGRMETIEYVEGPTAFYILVLTAQSPRLARTYGAAFQAFSNSFSPATVTQPDAK